MCIFAVDDNHLLSLHIRGKHFENKSSICCSQNKCCAAFNSLQSFLRHLKKFHLKSKTALTREVSSVFREEFDSCAYVEPNADFILMKKIFVKQYETSILDFILFEMQIWS